MKNKDGACFINARKPVYWCYINAILFATKHWLHFSHAKSKKHQENLLEIDEEFITHAYRLAKEKFYPLLKEKLSCDGLTIVQNNFYGPMVQHFHFHLTPRYKNDEYKEISNKNLLEDIDEIYTKLTK